MHEHLGSFTQNPSQKFHKNFINFEKPQNLSLMREMHEEWRIKDPYQRRKAWSRLKSKWGRWRVWVRSVWERIERVFVERDRWELKKNHVLTIYRQIHSSMDQQVSIIKNSQMKLSRGIHSKVISMDRAAIENLSSIQKLPRWIEKLLRSYWD